LPKQASNALHAQVQKEIFPKPRSTWGWCPSWCCSDWEWKQPRSV